MAIVNNGTIVSVNASKIPTGYTLPTVTEVVSTQPNYENISISIVKSTVEAASKLTTFTALVAEVTTAVTARLNADFPSVTSVITVHAVLKDYRTNQIISEELLTNVANSYICTVDIFVNIA